MLFKKKKTQTPPENTEAGGEQKFQKDIKVLWIYTTLFCLSALLLILISFFIQKKINSTADYYQWLYEGEKTSSQSTIKNIQTENTALRNENAALKDENAELKTRNEHCSETINAGAELAQSYEYIALAQNAGSRSKARSYLEKVDPEILTGDMQKLYEKLCRNYGV
ncbi:MAG: hypothetical protein IJ408_05120 [Clostridia bacterium]|nr:hypothetical protein [Clostridia bacterium]